MIRIGILGQVRETVQADRKPVKMTVKLVEHGSKSSEPSQLVAVIVEIVASKSVISYAVIIRIIFHIQLDRIKPYDYQAAAAFVASHVVTLFTIGIDKYFFAAFGTNRCWHWCWSPETME